MRTYMTTFVNNINSINIVFECPSGQSLSPETNEVGQEWNPVELMHLSMQDQRTGQRGQQICPRDKFAAMKGILQKGRDAGLCQSLQ